MSDVLINPGATAGLTAKQLVILNAVKAHSERLLDHTPRFKFFTLHGRAHLNSLFDILALLRKGGIELDGEQLFLLSLASCIHDLGMVVKLGDKDIREILDGRPGYPDATALENYIRDRHHELLDHFFNQELTFLIGLGVTPTQIGLVRDISRCHRKVVLQEQRGIVRDLGALLRVIDELDIGSARAPADVFQNISGELDATSHWHWFKHNIVEAWIEGHTVNFLTDNSRKKIIFNIGVRPTRKGSIDYWLTQIRRPIAKALLDDGAQRIIRDKFNVEIEIRNSNDLSSVNSLDSRWDQLEERALSANRKVILVIDDEVRKLEDLFLPLMDNYHIIYAFSAKDAISKLEAATVALAIVDMQVGSGGIWTESETEEFKMTGRKMCQYISEKYPKTRVGILTGTRYSVKNLSDLNLVFFLRKPIHPSDLTNKINEVLS